MPEAKNNRRVRFTRSALREALIDLILEKPLVSITVKDICARADINRSTFYLHFKDVTDILRTTEDEIIEHMHEHPCALYVTQKIMPKSCAVRCAFDKAGNISNNK